MIYNKGSVARARFAASRSRRRFTLNEKVNFLTAIDEMVATGKSQNKAATILQVDPTCISRWRAQAKSLGQSATCYGDNVCAPLAVNGRISFLNEIVVEFLGFIGSWRDRGLPVS